MDSQSVITVVLTSTLVSSLVSLVMKAVIQARITHKCNVEMELLKSKHQLEIETLKADLAMHADTEREIAERRLRAYPRIVELVYRTRNMCRDLASRVGPGTFSLIPELASRAKELEDAVYEFRIDLEHDKEFMGVHSYKNEVLNFCMKVSDVKYFIEHDEQARAEVNQKELNSMYEPIEASHSSIIESLSSLK